MQLSPFASVHEVDVVQVPPTHVSLPQETPQLPQLSGSVEVSTHVFVVAQYVGVVASQAHMSFVWHV